MEGEWGFRSKEKAFGVVLFWPYITHALPRTDYRSLDLLASIGPSPFLLFVLFSYGFTWSSRTAKGWAEAVEGRDRVFSFLFS